jgi:predicted short-subunit dehydrogenase-like oxidoreductase (DUF2520 family)
MLKDFSVIGAGNLGTHLIHSLVNRGYHLRDIYLKSKFGLFPDAITGDIQGLVAHSDFIVIATQESKIPGVVHLLSLCPHVRGKIIFHTANALTSDALGLLKQKGAHVASFSPLQTFPPFHSDTPADVFAGIYFLAEGDPEAIIVAQAIAAHLHAQLIEVEKEKKVYFHIAAVAASNFLISILKLADHQLHKTGDSHPPLDINLLLPLIYQTLENVRANGLEASLTGPFKRKEMAIIEKHLALLDREDATLYRALTHYLEHWE